VRKTTNKFDAFYDHLQAAGEFANLTTCYPLYDWSLSLKLDTLMSPDLADETCTPASADH